jgi:F-type H+-transporting ATPase subunit beta
METATKTNTTHTMKGKIIQIVGVVVDIAFPADKLPAIYNALTVKLADGVLTLEVAQCLM